MYITDVCRYVCRIYPAKNSNFDIRPNKLPAGHRGTSPDRWHEASGWAAPRVHTRQLGPGKRVILVFAIYIYMDVKCMDGYNLHYDAYLYIYIYTMYIPCISCDFYVYVVPRYVFIHL